MERVRVVVVGNGYAGYCQLPALRWAERNGGPRVDVTGLCARDMDKARATAARFGVERVTEDLDVALSTSPDLVIVSTPVDLHAAHVQRALERTAAAILCEKPFTLDVGSARALAAQARGRLALVDHQLRWSAPRRAFRERLGDVGTPWVARAEMCFGSVERLQRRWSWWDDKARGGGALWAIGSHLVDGLLWLLGPVVDVQGRLTSCVQARADADGAPRAVTADDHAELWLTHASGARSSVLCTTVQTHGRRALLEVIGARGLLRLVDEEELTFARHGEPPARVAVKLAGVDEVEACNDSAFARSEPLFLRDVLLAVARGARELAGAATFDDGAAVTAALSAVGT
jgi:predicted dehydrogenase